MQCTQPDFNALFLDTFSRQVSGVSYRVRDDSNFQHDVQFLKSLVYESQFELKDIKHNKQTLEILLLRSRWELRDEIEKYNVIKIPSILKFSRVKKIRWCATDITHSSPFEEHLIENGDTINGDTQCEIDTIFMAESSRRDATIEFVIRGYPGDWNIRIFLPHEGFAITLKDSRSNVVI